MISQAGEPPKQAASLYGSAPTLLPQTHPEHCQRRPDPRGNEKEMGDLSFLRIQRQLQFDFCFCPFLVRFSFTQKNQSDSIKGAEQEGKAQRTQPPRRQAC